MADRQVIVFRSRLRPGIGEAYGQRGEEMWNLASRMPGYVSSTDFVADDGERCTIVEWDGVAQLGAWRELPAHKESQQHGREHWYASYRLQVCRELRGSAFDGRTRTSHTRDTRGIGEAWLARFNARDLDGLLALYHDDAVHTSPKIRVRHPETGGLLRGKPALRAWWQDSFDRLPSMRYEPTALTADSERVFMEYIRHVDGDAPYPVAEVLECRDGLIVASRVFHG